MARRAIDNRLNTLDIGLPGTIGTPVGVRDLDAEGHALVAKFALSHPLHLLAVTYWLLAFASIKHDSRCLQKMQALFDKKKKKFREWETIA